MLGSGSRLLYLARHAEPQPDGSALTARGRAQAKHLGRRLAHLPLRCIAHGPLPRATETATIVAQQFAERPQLTGCDAAGDYVPSVPRAEDVPPSWAGTVLSSFADVTDEQSSDGADLGAHAIDLFAGAPDPARPSVEVVITHAFTIGWLVRHALDAPEWRWWGPNHCHAGLTVIRYRLDAPPTVVVSNDVSHLPPELRWTGFPDDLRI